jgi:hypothetical protein
MDGLNRFLINLVFLVLIVTSTTGFAADATTLEQRVNTLELEIKILKLQLEKLQVPFNDSASLNATKNLTGHDYVMFHRGEQESKRFVGNRNSELLKYKAIYEKNKNGDNAYLYLRAITIAELTPEEDYLKLLKQFVFEYNSNTWLNYLYAYQAVKECDSDFKSLNGAIKIIQSDKGFPEQKKLNEIISKYNDNVNSENIINTIKWDFEKLGVSPSHGVKVENHFSITKQKHDDKFEVGNYEYKVEDIIEQYGECYVKLKVKMLNFGSPNSINQLKFYLDDKSIGRLDFKESNANELYINVKTSELATANKIRVN